MLHQYLRAIGFSNLNSRKQLNDLLRVAIRNADERFYTTYDDDAMLSEYHYMVGENIGLTVRGEYDESNQFMYDYYFPFFRGTQVSSYADVSVERHVEKESYAGICDDTKVGVSLIFYLQNIVSYIKRRNTDQIPKDGTALTLSALSTKGTIIMPLYKDEEDIRKIKEVSQDRNMLIQKARKGDENAIETLTLEDMDTYNNISRLIVKTDVLSLVDTYFMPYGVECDLYTILGEITDVQIVQNDLTKESVYQMIINCNDMLINLCIHTEDLMGEPQVGRRFRGTIWLQGMIHYENE